MKKPAMDHEINLANDKFWRVKSKAFLERAISHPENIEKAVNRLRNDLLRGQDIRTVANIERDVFADIDYDHERLRRLAKKDRKPKRPKQNPGRKFKCERERSMAQSREIVRRRRTDPWRIRLPALAEKEKIYASALMQETGLFGFSRKCLMSRSINLRKATQ